MRAALSGDRHVSDAAQNGCLSVLLRDTENLFWRRPVHLVEDATMRGRLIYVGTTCAMGGPKWQLVGRDRGQRRNDGELEDVRSKKERKKGRSPRSSGHGSRILTPICGAVLARTERTAHSGCPCRYFGAVTRIN